MPVSSASDFAPAFQKAFDNGDLEGLLSLYADDVVAVPQPGARLNGKAEVSAGLQAFLAMTPYTMAMTSSLVESPSAAIVYLDWAFDGTSPDGPVHIEARASVALAHGAGGWVAVVDDFFSQA